MKQNIIPLNRPTPESGRTYSTKVIQEAIDKAQFPLFAQLRASDTVCLNEVSHQINKLYIENDCLMAEFTPLDTPAYHKIKDLEVKWTLVGTGTAKNSVINPGYEISYFYAAEPI